MLTYIQINAAKPRAKAWSLLDAQGLHIFIQPNGSKLWRFNSRFLDKQKTLPLGGWPQVSLADARVRRDEAKKKIAEGIDPALEKKRARIAGALACQFDRPAGPADAGKRQPRRFDAANPPPRHSRRQR